MFCRCILFITWSITVTFNCKYNTVVFQLIWVGMHTLIQLFSLVHFTSLLWVNKNKEILSHDRFKPGALSDSATAVTYVVSIENCVAWRLKTLIKRYIFRSALLSVWQTFIENTALYKVSFVIAQSERRESFVKMCETLYEYNEDYVTK